jgi:hypothetical protein
MRSHGPMSSPTALTIAQRAYQAARIPFDALDERRDRLLEPIDCNDRLVLSKAEREAVEQLTRAQAEIYPWLLAVEPPLLDAARTYLGEHPEIGARHPEYAILAGPIQLGKRDYAIDLALQLGLASQNSIDL